MTLIDPLPELVDALGLPLRQEPTSTFANVDATEPPPDLLELRGWMNAYGLRWPRPAFDRIRRTRYLPVKHEDGAEQHGHLDERTRTLFVSHEVFDRLRAETGAK